MPRLSRSSRLETREARKKLAPQHEPYWHTIEPGFHLGYRKPKSGKAGTWIARKLVADLVGKRRYMKQSLGKADDFGDDNEVDVFRFATAQTRARAWQDKLARRQAGYHHDGPYTVEAATSDYLEWFAAHRKSIERVTSIVKANILSELGQIEVEALTARQIRAWHEKLASRPARLRSRRGTPPRYRPQNDPRARKATANRSLTVLKAALNHAWRDGLVESDTAWRRVKPFQNVNLPKVRFLTEDECRRLVNACQADFRLLVQGALYTGCRYGELTRLTVGDFNSTAGYLAIAESKNGKTRYVPLTQEGLAFFQRQVTGKSGDNLIFQRKDGAQWGTSHQIRLMNEASAAAEIAPKVAFHILRHTYASQLAMSGAPLHVIAEALGHADTRITAKHYAHLMPSYVADTIRTYLPDLGQHQPDNVVQLVQ